MLDEDALPITASLYFQCAKQPRLATLAGGETRDGKVYVIGRFENGGKLFALRARFAAVSC